MGRACSTRGGIEIHTGKRQLGRTTCWWEDNIKMYHREIRWGDTDWIHLAQDRDKRRAPVNTAMYLRVL
jgi:hypothetical protein